MTFLPQELGENCVKSLKLILIYLGMGGLPISELIARAFITTELTLCLRLRLEGTLEAAEEAATPVSLFGLGGGSWTVFSGGLTCGAGTVLLVLFNIQK